MGEDTSRVPRPLTPLLGRDSELEAARVLLRAQRLMTVVGTGGTGKTRLAVEVVADVPEAAFVDLSPLSDARLVLPTVARAVGLRESGAQHLAETLVRHLRDREDLLVLDNVEHVLDATPEIAELLARCPRVRVLATSRCPLRVPGEYLLPLSPLAVPEPSAEPGSAELADVASVALFVARVEAAQPDLALSAADIRTIVEICRALDGLPLALELAAAQVRAHGLAAVLAGTRTTVEGPGPVPRRGVPERHRSLEAALGWSVALLDDEASVLFRRLSVFAGGWTAAAAQRVCGEPERDVSPALTALVEHSLVEPVHHGPVPRYRLLETLRRYSAGMPRVADEAELLRRHAGWCRSIAADVVSAPGPDEAARFAFAESELDNLRLALDSCPPADTSTGLRTAADLYFFWDIRGYLGEGVHHLRRLLDRPEAAADPVGRLAALQSLGLLLVWRDELAEAYAALREAAEIAERIDDPGAWAWCAGSLAIAHFVGGDVDAVVTLAERGLSVAREVDAWMPLLRTTCGLGLVRWGQGRHAEARALVEENAQLAAPSPWAVAKASYFLGWFAFLDGDLAEADRRFRSGATTFERVGDHRSLPDCQDGAACVAAARGDAQDASALLASADELRARAGSLRSTYLRPHCELAATRARAALDAAVPAGITRREYDVARLVAGGLTNRQIGRRLDISERTAERHVENLRRKLEVHTRAQVAAWVAVVPTSVSTTAAITHTGVRRTPVH